MSVVSVMSVSGRPAAFSRYARPADAARKLRDSLGRLQVNGWLPVPNDITFVLADQYAHLAVTITEDFRLCCIKERRTSPMMFYEASTFRHTSTGNAPNCRGMSYCCL